MLPFDCRRCLSLLDCLCLCDLGPGVVLLPECRAASSRLSGCGAARAAYRLHESLLRAGLNSQMLVQFKAGDDVSVVGPSGKIKRGMGLLRPTLDLVPTLAYRNRTQTLFSPAWLPLSGIVSEINRLAPDVVHLHWVNGGALTIGDIAKIKPPIVWTMHDQIRG